MGYTDNFDWEFKGIRCQNKLWKQKNHNFLWTHVLLTTDAGYLKSENVFQPGYISILQPLELRIIGHSNITESNLWEKNISMVDHKLQNPGAVAHSYDSTELFSGMSIWLNWKQVCHLKNMYLLAM